MGKSAREKVIEKFSVKANRSIYLKVFDKTFKNIN